MTAGLEDIRAAIGAVMATVPNVGVVQPYERYAKTEKDFAALYLRPDGASHELRGWFIRRLAYRETVYLRSQTMFAIDWQLRGFMALQDTKASEIVMDDLVEQIRIAFKRDLTLGGRVLPPNDPGQPVGVQLTESGPYMFAGILCHGVSLNLTTTLADDAIPAADRIGDFATFHANWDVPPFGNVPLPLPDDAKADATDHVTLETE